MRNFPRTFWRRKSQEKNPAALFDDCMQVQSLITVAFDGEATGEALIQAQRHIAECRHCAELWAQWEYNRVLLRSVPVPAVPASLLTRILLACRLMPLQSADFSAPADQSARAKLVQYMEALEDETTAASLSHIMTPVAVPHDLQRRILQATCNAPHSPRLSLVELLRRWMPTAPVSRHAMRWGMGLAVPAMAAWFILVGQVESPVSSSISSAENDARQNISAKNNAVKVPAIVAGAKPILKPLVKQAMGAAKALPHIAAVADVSAPTSSDEDKPSLRRVVSSESFSGFKRSDAKAVSIAARPVSSPSAPRRVRTYTKPAINLIENRPSGLVLAASRRTISRLPLNATPQISHPPVASAPRLARMSESDFDEAFVAVTTARDNRPVEFGLAIDEYRAALLSDTADTEEETEEL